MDHPIGALIRFDLTRRWCASSTRRPNWRWRGRCRHERCRAAEHHQTLSGPVTALNDVSFEVHDGEFFVLLGPTGAGKTTTLRVIAGLESRTRAAFSSTASRSTTLPPADRDVAFVFQQYSLYPTMSVYDNLAFPLRSPMRQTPEPEIKSA